ncbi:chorismate-binding protein [Paenibacillus sp. M1]|uniref:Chorismate-binding protein n=1 Tax=Paenibacillus haidiansis TaxID=1574488 RepID=A0ABU7VUJ6_9BACL
MKILEGLKTETVSSRIDNPIALYSLVRSKYKDTSILESLGPVNEDTARYTIIGVIAAEKLVCRDGQTSYTDLTSNSTDDQAEFLSVMNHWVKLGGRRETPLQLGAIGYLGYEMKSLFERYDQRLTNDTGIPDAYLVRYSLMHVTDHYAGQAYWLLNDDEHRKAIAEFENAPCLIHAEQHFYVMGDITSDFSEDEYLEIIERTKEYIRAGDIFQANITMRFHCRYDGDPFILYLRMRETTPNPFFGYLDFDMPLLSTSPERFLKVSGRSISSYPIKGTSLCQIDGIDQKEELRNSEKNRAENTMITDLLRNDIGRVSEQGSVNVPILCGVKKFNNLYHLESIVEGTLRPNLKMSDILQATFPGGSITGAPKIRAVDIIEELELTQRGPYTGMIGFFGESGYIDSNIAIRSIYFNGSNLYFHAGGGIVVDSEARSEYEELNNKVRSISETCREFNILKDYRAQIDVIDGKLLQLLNERFHIVKQVGAVKEQYGIPVTQSKRIDEVLDKRTKYGQELGDVPPGLIPELFTLIIEFAMKEEETDSAASAN